MRVAQVVPLPDGPRPDGPALASGDQGRLWHQAAELLATDHRRVGIYLTDAGSDSLRLCATAAAGRGEASRLPDVLALSAGSLRSANVVRVVRQLRDGADLYGAVVIDVTAGGSPIEPGWLTRFTKLLVAARQDQLEAAGRHVRLEQRYRELVSAREVERRLHQVAGRADAVQALVRACSELIGKVTILLDATGRLVGAGGATAPGLRLHSFDSVVAEWGRARGPEVRAVTVHQSGLRDRRYLVAPVRSRGQELGWVVVLEQASPFGPHDRYVVGRAADQAAVELTVLLRVNTSVLTARSTLTRQLIGRTAHPDDLRNACARLGVDPAARRVVLFLTPGSRELTHDVEACAARLERSLGAPVLATRGSEGAVFLVDAPEDRAGPQFIHDIKEALGALLDEDGDGFGLFAGIASISEPAGLPAAYREAREAAHYTVRFTGVSPTRILAVDDLGPARVFLAARNDASMEGYIQQVLGPLIASSQSDSGLLETLSAFLSSHAVVRSAAERLGVHENTVRLRLARVRNLTGLDVARDLNAQLSAHTALILLRLRGNPVLARLDSPSIHW